MDYEMRDLVGKVIEFYFNEAGKSSTPVQSNIRGILTRVENDCIYLEHTLERHPSEFKHRYVGMKQNYVKSDISLLEVLDISREEHIKSIETAYSEGKKRNSKGIRFSFWKPDGSLDLPV